MELRSEIRRRLAALQARELPLGDNRRAAVLMLIFEQDGEPHFLLTRRTDEVETHKGQVSFPGGMQHEGESLESTALRETFEEVGIDAGRIEMLGRFHEYFSTTGYLVTPFAAFINGVFSTAAQEREVAEILYAPFSLFRDPGRLRVEKMFRLGKMTDVYFYSFGNYEIWGLTARIIKDFLDELR